MIFHLVISAAEAQAALSTSNQQQYRHHQNHFFMKMVWIIAKYPLEFNAVSTLIKEVQEKSLIEIFNMYIGLYNQLFIQRTLAIGSPRNPKIIFQAPNIREQAQIFPNAQSLLQYMVIDLGMENQSSKIFQQPLKVTKSLLLVNRKKFKNIRHCHAKRGNQKRGMWNLVQTIKYIEFAKQHMDKLLTEEGRRESKVFCLMAKEIRTRSSVQCRSHHQKMIQTHGDLHHIIIHYEENVIPYYSAKATPSETKSSEEPIPEPNFTVKRVGNAIRIEICQEWIASY